MMTDKLKKISGSESIFNKRIFPYIWVGIMLAIIVLTWVGKIYPGTVIAGLFLLIFLVKTAMRGESRIADALYLDYSKKEFLFEFRGGRRKVIKNFTELVLVKKRLGPLVSLWFSDGQHYFFYLNQISFTAYSTEKSILEELNSIAQMQESS